jgi:hypothetical protein
MGLSKRVQRLIWVMGIEALVPRPGASKAAPGRKIYLPVARQEDYRAEPRVAADMTYIPMACVFLYLVAIIDWASRAILAWRLSNTTMLPDSSRNIFHWFGAPVRAVQLEMRVGFREQCWRCPQ